MSSSANTDFSLCLFEGVINIHNYEHEIPCPPNRGINTFLWYDYFHDSHLQNIEFDKMKKTVTLMYECAREIEDKWKELKGDEPYKRQYIESHADEFIYFLTFKYVLYFQVDRLPCANDYINGRFKDSALLHYINTEQKNPCYHFRIQCDDGYIDIIFSDFIIRKKQGRIRYLNTPFSAMTCSSLDAPALDETIMGLVKQAQTGEDFERFLAMSKLWQLKYSELIQLARGNITLPDDYEDSVPYSAYLLGKLGDESDLPLLQRLYLSIQKLMTERSICLCSTLLPKRNILDAIENINYRNKNR